MKKKIILFSLVLFYCNPCFGQGISNIWMGGYGNQIGNPPWGGWKMDFFSGSPVITYENRAIDFDVTGTTISDSSGNFLFATNGVTIMNNVGDTMQNGSGLSPSTYSSPQWFGDGLRLPQATLILPLPESTNIYYIFHMTIDTISSPSYSYFFYNSIIDMNLDGSKGVVITKNQVIQTGLYAAGGIVACKHANGRDWWINIHDRNGTGLHFFLLTPVGVSFSHSQAFNYREGVGVYNFSPDGTRFGGYNSADDFELFDFDRCSGMLSNFRQVTINDSTVAFGCAFSPNSQYLYGSSARYFYQVDVTSNQPDTTLKTVAIWDGTYYNNSALSFSLSGLAPDGKIYITSGSTTPIMHIINYPDSLGVACDVQQHSVYLPVYNSYTVPNHPNYFLGALIGSGCDTLSGVGIEEFTNLKLKLSPNPTSGLVSLSYPSIPESGHLEIYNVVGQNVYSSALPPWSSFQNLDVSEIPSGIYLLKIKWGTKSSQVKFVKQ